MTWFRENRFLGIFLVALAVATLGALIFLWSARSSFNDARAQFEQSATELNRLQRLTPFPNDANLKKVKTQSQDYASDLNKLKEELRTRVLPQVPLAPNEFQSRLRQAIAAVTERARTNKVRLPENFFLGFEEFASSLPDTAAAPLLGQQLAQAELLVNTLLEAHVEAITAFRRVPPNESLLPAPATPAATPAPAKKGPTAASAAPTVERSTVEASFVAPANAVRRVLNQISTLREQFYVMRTLHVLNEKDKGPARESATATPAAPAPTPGPNSALNFIVGNEKVQVAARIEMLRFNF